MATRIQNSPDTIEKTSKARSFAGKETIIFDDDKFYCMLFKQNVDRDLTCDFATNEVAFFRKIDRHHYDFAIIDYDLHSTNAITIAERMKDEFDLPVIIISSSLNNLFNCQAPGHDDDSNIIGVVSKWEDPKFIVAKALEYAEGHEPLAPGLEDDD